MTSKNTIDPFEVTLRVRNNQLKARRLALGMSQREFAKMAGVTISSYSRLENLQRDPFSHVDGRPSDRWSEPALAIAAAHCCDPEELWPDAVLAVVSPVITKTMSEERMAMLAYEYTTVALLPPPDEFVAKNDLVETLNDVVNGLSEREVTVLRHRFGLQDEAQETIDELGQRLGVSRSRVSQIERGALRKMRRSGRLVRRWNDRNL